MYSNRAAENPDRLTPLALAVSLEAQDAFELLCQGIDETAAASECLQLVNLFNSSYREVKN